MELRTDGKSLSMRGGRVALRVSQTALGDTTKLMTLEVERSEPFEIVEIALKLEPWSPDAYDVQDWEAADVIIVSGAGRVVAVSLHAPRSVAAMGLEYEEAESIDRPWIIEAGSDALIVATERRVWCVDASASIRWCWNARTGPEESWVCSAPRVDSMRVLVPMRSRRGEVITCLSIRDGSLE